MTTGKIKTLIVLLVLILTAIFPLGEVQSLHRTLISVGIAFVWGVIFPQFPYYNTLFETIINKKPRWSDKFDLKYPLSYIQFFAFFILATGAGNILGGLFKGQYFNYFGVILLALGMSVLIGMYLIPNTLKPRKDR